MSANAVSLAQFGSVASTGSATVVIPVPSGVMDVELVLGAIYAAVASTTGTTFAFQYSPDNSTWTNANVNSVLVKNGAGVRADGTATLFINNVLKTWSNGPINYIKVTITNADTANAVQTAVLALFHTGLV